jgi:asparagine synthase (glutamine-hydrolysing)
MCGILGYAAPEGAAPNFDLATAVKRLAHRGPDDSGLWREGSTELGFVRLAIIDLSPAGHQPMLSPCDRYAIVFNGEIYNFPELRAELEAKGETFVGHSDTEILLRLFAREGLEACLARLRGMFAFAVWDRQTRSLSLARDRLGVKPLVYAETARGFVFGSEIAALFAIDPQLPRAPDFQALDHYLSFQYIPAPLSGFAAVRKLPPGHAMVVRDGRIERIFRYWDIDFSKRSTLSFPDACEALREKILEATKIRMISDVPLGAFLSGGIDSSITVAAMARLSDQPIKTFAIGFDDERFNELPFARQVATHLGTEHREMMVRPDAVEWLPRLIEHLGEPLADNSILPTFYVSRFAREQVTVALTGDGGDESFAGYRRFYQMRRADVLARAGLTPVWRGLRRFGVAVENRLKPHRAGRSFPATRADEMLFLKGAEAYKHLLAFYPDADKERLLTEAFRARRGPSQTSAYLEAVLARAAGADTTTRWCYADLMTYLPEDILFKVDIASMAVSLECRSPFLDHRVVEFAYSLPGPYKLTARGRHKHILKEAFKDWLPAGFMDRPKQGFSAPLARWLREDFGPLLRERLIERQTLAPWFDQAQVTRYVEEHLSGRGSHSQKLWPLLVLAIWVDRFEVPVSA